MATCGLPMRIDKFLWCVRRFKTRSIATDAVRREQVQVNGRVVKPSIDLKAGDVIALREPPIWRSWEILGMPTSRVGAKLVSTFIAERTSFADLEKLEIARLAKAQERPTGEGRPTKRDRRDMERFRGE
ncbi:MAG: RNA-binding S4 domain-containing protein [Flavobacteriales bacterium]|nr:RNA-binding S4 domain-containing protein [Flavobacteriales bacterium]